METVKNRITQNISAKLLLAVMSAFLLILSLPEGNTPQLAWIALFPAILLTALVPARTCFWLLWPAGWLYMSTVHLWANVFGVHVWLALSLWQSLYLGLWGWLTAKLLQDPAFEKSLFRLFIPALTWLLYEFIRGSGPMALNWGSPGYTQYRCIPLIQTAGITGIYGISFLLLLVSSLAAYWLEFPMTGKKLRPLKKFTVITAGLLAMALVYGLTVTFSDPGAPTRKITVSAVQPSTDMSLKWDESSAWKTAAGLVELTETALADRPDLILWPETAITFPIPQNRYVTDYLSRQIRTFGADTVVGAVQHGEEGKKLNTAFHFNGRGEIVGQYSKRHLVPFGEYLPLPDSWRKWTVFDRVKNFRPGENRELFQTEKGKFGVIICFESDFPVYSRNYVNQGAEFIAVITNDGWFEHYPAARHHISWNVMRAAENRCPLVQSANTGISAFIDRCGRIEAETGLFEKAVLTADIGLRPAGTFYTVFGDLFLYAALLALAAGVIKYKRRRKFSAKV